MENEITRPVAEELESLKRYLAKQSAALQVVVDGEVPSNRYVIPRSFELIVQHALRYQQCSDDCPLVVVLSFQKYAIEVSYPVQPRETPDESFLDLKELASLYRQFYSVPTFTQTRETCTVSIPLFI